MSTLLHRGSLSSASFEPSGRGASVVERPKVAPNRDTSTSAPTKRPDARNEAPRDTCRGTQQTSGSPVTIGPVIVSNSGRMLCVVTAGYNAQKGTKGSNQTELHALEAVEVCTWQRFCHDRDQAALLSTVTELLSADRSMLGGGSGGGAVSTNPLLSCNRAGMAGGKFAHTPPPTTTPEEAPPPPPPPLLPVYMGDSALTVGAIKFCPIGERPTAEMMREEFPKF
uniref:Uncharacterized protein n=1 Tax=Anopheles farauti TaxID=69004 RepID=A0A182QVD8_9DIPT